MPALAQRALLDLSINDADKPSGKPLTTINLQRHRSAVELDNVCRNIHEIVHRNTCHAVNPSRNLQTFSLIQPRHRFLLALQLLTAASTLHFTEQYSCGLPVAFNSTGNTTPHPSRAQTRSTMPSASRMAASAAALCSAFRTRSRSCLAFVLHSSEAYLPRPLARPPHPQAHGSTTTLLRSSSTIASVSRSFCFRSRSRWWRLSSRSQRGSTSRCSWAGWIPARPCTSARSSRMSGRVTVPSPPHPTREAPIASRTTASRWRSGPRRTGSWDEPSPLASSPSRTLPHPPSPP